MRSKAFTFRTGNRDSGSYSNNPQPTVHSAPSSSKGLSSATLREALRNVFNRHEILRTAFRFLPSMSLPVQVMAESDDSAARTGHETVTRGRVKEEARRVPVRRAREGVRLRVGRRCVSTSRGGASTCSTARPPSLKPLSLSKTTP